MTEEQARIGLENVRSGQQSEIVVEKQDFLVFREILMKAEDVAHFRGRARHHGITVYTYEPGWSK
ncbi:hypothetical protein [Alkalicoccobacillus porphyridii]|uniref:Uncharacterized protein n=1 Tax=Alkalicoccobacillus porphyridii TaxID=2597270 RepID=A0A553ZUS0_9BACI|nr:hypothetical protein [Alkalicoccobacillus porphyridii]TSB45163.1 hypothetical protein FN960_17975 [Alkalicoccobacillus porphyridii]